MLLHVLAWAGIGAAAGLLIGCIGVGGVIVVPLVVVFPASWFEKCCDSVGDVSDLSKSIDERSVGCVGDDAIDFCVLSSAVVSAMFCYIFAGLVGTLSYEAQNPFLRNMLSSLFLCCSRSVPPEMQVVTIIIGTSVVGSAAGIALLVFVFDAFWVKLILYVLMALSSSFCAWRNRDAFAECMGATTAGEGEVEANNEFVDVGQEMSVVTVHPNDLDKVDSGDGKDSNDSELDHEVDIKKEAGSPSSTIPEINGETKEKVAAEELVDDALKKAASDVDQLEQMSGEGEVGWNAAKAAGVGVITGLVSSATGTSGPVTLLPLILSWPLQLDVLLSLQLAQLVQIPIAIVASISAYLMSGTVYFDVPLIIGLAIGMMGGVIIGSLVAHKLPAQQLKVAVAVVLVSVSILLIARMVVSEISG